MKKLITLCLATCGFSFAIFPGVCEISDAQKERFEKPVEYEIMKECMGGSFHAQNVSGYQDKLEYCSCVVGALHCYFKTVEKLNNADEKKMEKAMNLAQKCYDKSK